MTQAQFVRLTASGVAYKLAIQGQPDSIRLHMPSTRFYAYLIWIAWGLLATGGLSHCGKSLPASAAQASHPPKIRAHFEVEVRAQDVPTSFSSPWNWAISHGIKQVEKFDLEQVNLDLLHPIDELHYERFLAGVPISGHFDEVFPQALEQGLEYYLYHVEEHEGMRICSVIRKDDLCCLSLFFITLSNQTDNLLSAACVAVTGGDDQWQIREGGKRTKPGAFQFYSSERVWEARGANYRMTFDSTQTKFQLMPNGQFARRTRNVDHYSAYRSKLPS
ncbi:hypothetical protein [Pontibacter sp. G13]|uniref:hypothetical protein n=1 Tax=Pontibacter sp. G13 TaxID=3074898 RepID=UPI0028894505|nr:hypothetical protein [Pontibacter sp. G13]WNJ20616.1 hypothetical protein RJD25_09040 [Pontibacter sp. G13]